MKGIRISDAGYAKVCQVAADHQTYLMDALDMIIFGKVPSAKAEAKPKVKRKSNKPRIKPSAKSEVKQIPKVEDNEGFVDGIHWGKSFHSDKPCDVCGDITATWYHKKKFYCVNCRTKGYKES
jgi:hypothetical protein